MEYLHITIRFGKVGTKTALVPKPETAGYDSKALALQQINKWRGRAKPLNALDVWETDVHTVSFESSNTRNAYVLYCKTMRDDQQACMEFDEWKYKMDKQDVEAMFAVRQRNY